MYTKIRISLYSDMCKVWPTHKKNPWVSIENMEEIFFEYQVAVTISIFYVAIYYDII